MIATTGIYSEIDLLNSLDDAIWSLTQASRVLQELRRDISVVWEDEAAREINSRYLNPHEVDALSMRDEIQEQVELLKQADQKLHAAKEFRQEADNHAKTVVERNQFARQDLDNAYSSYDVFVQYNADARAKLPAIHQLINRANSACE
ncbi:MAG TPA: hypothetical protein VJM50_11830 [Pyrinomonadaceae bacterium]|nr:hypothetical protein [Pyrinomonadaceae bacterium]